MGQKDVNRERGLQVVLDTSVFVSAVLFRGPTNRLVHLGQTGAISILVSSDVLKEYIKVLAYSKFNLTKDEMTAIVEQELLPFIKPVKISKVHPVITQDPADDKFLALAVEGKADYILSGDKHLLTLKAFRGIKVLSPDKFFEILKEP